MTVWLFPIEPLVERYSEQWYRWWPEKLRAAGANVRVVDGERLKGSIEFGEFLDPVDTHYYKATQLAAFFELVNSGAVRNRDTVLLLDAWSPAVTALAYLRDTCGPRIRLVGCLHAGTWDPNDYLSQQGLGRWAGEVERGWFAALDTVLVATNYHRQLLTRAGCALARVVVTGFPLYPEFVTPERAAVAKEPIVVFPHRLAPEKAPEEFWVLQKLYEGLYGVSNDVQWVRTKDVCGSKDAYYDLLARAKVAVSTARQETWGIAMLEAALLGCHPVAPARLSYPETLEGCCYKDLIAAAARVHDALNAPSRFVYDGTRWTRAIRTIAGLL
jgi:glycosyltransferase involved in cell wall biosynthesis